MGRRWPQGSGSAELFPPVQTRKRVETGGSVLSLPERPRDLAGAGHPGSSLTYPRGWAAKGWSGQSWECG